MSAELNGRAVTTFEGGANPLPVVGQTGVFDEHHVRTFRAFALGDCR